MADGETTQLFRRDVLEGTATGQWVTLDVAMEALGISKRRARELATSEGWRIAPGTRPRQYAFADIRRTYQHRRTESSTS